MNMKAVGNSMYPTLMDGRIYPVEPVKDGDIKVGDIIIFLAGNKLICHRVIKISIMRNGQSFYKTKGDNCIDADPYAITSSGVIGRIVDI